MTLFDGIVVAVLAISGFLALLRGFTNEVLSILAWVVGALASLWLFPYATPLFHTFISSDVIAAIAAALSIFIIVYLLMTAFTMRWADRLLALHDNAESLDRTLGLAFGVVRGLLIVTVAYLFFAWLVPSPADQPAWVRNAKLRPVVESCAEMLFALAPGAPLRPGAEKTPPAAKAPPRPSPPANAQSGADSGEAPGYNSSERKGLDRLFESNTE